MQEKDERMVQEEQQGEEAKIWLINKS